MLYFPVESSLPEKLSFLEQNLVFLIISKHYKNKMLNSVLVGTEERRKLLQVPYFKDCKNEIPYLRSYFVLNNLLGALSLMLCIKSYKIITKFPYTSKEENILEKNLNYKLL